MATKKKEKKEKETPEQRFQRLAVPRVNAAIKRIALVGNLAAANYKSTPEQREKIVGALGAAIDKVNEKFSSFRDKDEKEMFQL